ncbi:MULTISPECIES: DUF971 domain-containing protein [Nostoc]|nr:MULTISPECIES: DUF971 domain-containing protein [Nostoc]
MGHGAWGDKSIQNDALYETLRVACFCAGVRGHGESLL